MNLSPQLLQTPLHKVRHPKASMSGEAINQCLDRAFYLGFFSKSGSRAAHQVDCAHEDLIPTQT